jgi:hypothetical protein
MAAKPKVTKLRIQIPRGMKIEDVIDKLEVSFEPATGAAAPHINSNFCCVDAAVAGPFSTVSESDGGGGGDDSA